MISIIVSSYQQHFFNAFSKNVASTIGNIPYEIIQIWNPGTMGICEAYNNGALEAQYEYLCFVHEDVLFATNNWGACIIAHLKNKNVGAIGIAGAAYKCKAPSSWSVVKEYRAINLIQHYTNKKKPKVERCNPGNDDTYRVVTLDGVFIATRKEVWEAHKFDQNVFKGFHGYDIDFSLAIAQKFELYAVFNVLLEHFSQGNPNRDWLEAAIQVSKKWERQLPFNCLDLDQVTISKIEEKCKQKFRQKLRNYKLGWFQRKLLILKYG